ncbi:MAG: hypothetical protein FJ358_08025 [Thaumarchaeota archaeon]|nr:hypothetical protein [Nitrososphaerota archaeon]
MVETSYQPLTRINSYIPIFSELEIQQLVEKYGTPIYIIDEYTLRKKVATLENAYSTFNGPVRVAYSIKANFNPAVMKVFQSEGIIFDLTSIGELEFFLRTGGGAENVIYTSVTEEKPEYETVIKSGVKRIVVSSYNGLINLIEVADGLGIQVSTMIRINPEVGVKAEVRASYRHGKFGVPFNGNTTDSATNMIRKIVATPSLKFDGFHFHLGSQIEDPTCFINALDKLEAFVIKMRKDVPDLEINVLDIGGGTPVFYGTPVPMPEEIGLLVAGRLNALCEALGSRFTLFIESGRYLAAEAAILISKIVNTKVYGGQKFIIVDAGYHLLLDAALLHQMYPQEVIPKSDKVEEMKLNLAGRLCDTYDIFPTSPASNLAGAEKDKLVVFKNIGAYSIVFNMPFHCQTKPPILMRRMNGEIQLIRKGETINELFKNEGGDLLENF